MGASNSEFTGEVNLNDPLGRKILISLFKWPTMALKSFV